MPVDVLLGLQWGDEGKGKIVDVIADGYDIIARFQGGPNAGHTLEFSGMKHVLHTIPSGIFHRKIINIIGNGVVIDPVVFKNEIDSLKQKNAAGLPNLLISKRAHLILPTHKLLDLASEKAKGEEKIGSTLRGIGPAYMDKTGRNGLRIGDIAAADFEKRFRSLTEKHLRLLTLYQHDVSDLESLIDGWMKGVECLKQFSHTDSEQYLGMALSKNKKILAEGAQGSLLDIDFGSYPYVTSSNTTCAGACSGLGIPPTSIRKVIGIFKAYCTRVGGGPFPAELLDETGDTIRKAGKEFGSTTGRPRRCGWLDLPALQYSILLNGVTELAIMKTDVLGILEKISVCTAYRHNGKLINQFPYALDGVEPVYRPFKGWQCDISEIRSLKKLPPAVSGYIKFIEKQTGLPVRMVSVGPERKQIVCR